MKPLFGVSKDVRRAVSPGPKAGGGLKLVSLGKRLLGFLFPPAPKPGAD